ncbi:MAG: translation initiation factor IF-2 [Candidatus Omnitrophota bacterium]
MQTIKLHEATKQFGISNKLAMFFLEKTNKPVKSHSSVITIDQLESLREFSENQNNFKNILNEFDELEREEKERKLRQQKEKEVPPTKSEEEVPQVVIKETEPEPEPEIPVPPTEPPVAPPTPKPEIPREPREPEVKPEPRPEPRPQPKVTSPGPQSAKPVEQRPLKVHPQPPQPHHAPRPTSPQPPRREPHPPRAERPEAKDVRKETPGERRPQPSAPAPSFDKKRKEESVIRIDRIEKEIVPDRDETKEGLKDRPVKKEKPKVKPKPKSDFIPYDDYMADVPGAIPDIPEVPIKKEIPVRPVRKDLGKKEFPGRKEFPKRDRFEPKRHEAPKEAPKPKPKERILVLPELVQTSNFINIKELAEKLNVKLRDIEDRMGALGKQYNTNQILTIEDINEICDEFKVPVDIVSFEDDIHNNHISEFKAERTPRAPVVTVMGHVDHGKTTLLDTLRKTRVAEKEAGGITQKIGAYKLTNNGNEIVFIDTPGHEAFTNIRARGAKVTDIVVLVVAANDGVQPQTVEAIDHARAANVPLVVAINKVDMEGADVNRVKQQLSRYGIVVEDWGGDVVSVEISAKYNKNLDTLLEMLTLSAEMLELKSYKRIPARGTIIESRLDPQLGPVGTVLIQHGILKRGDFFICGDSVGRVKTIFDDHGKAINEAEAPLPVEVMGFEEIPEAGELFQVTTDVEKARKVIELRKQMGKEARIDSTSPDKKMSLQNLFDKLGEAKSKEFPIIIKADNFSSSEVLEKVLIKQAQDTMKVNIIRKAVGNITEGDVLLAATSGAIIIGFNVKAPQKILGLAKRDKVEIRLYNIIYHLMEEFERVVKGEMAPEYIERFIGRVEVLQLFKISKVGIIAGCVVREGKITNKSKIKVMRKNDLVFEGEIETLKRVKNDASEVNAGTECGVRIKNFNAIEAGDMLEAYEVKLKV